MSATSGEFLRTCGMPRGSCCLPSKVSDGLTLRKKGVSATVVGINSEADSLIRRGMCSLLYGSRYGRTNGWSHSPLHENLVALVAEEVHTVSFW